MRPTIRTTTIRIEVRGARRNGAFRRVPHRDAAAAGIGRGGPG